MVVNDLTFEVPDGVTAEQAALTEPMAVAYHAVRRGDVGKRDVAVVIGCGPIGLAVIAVLEGDRHQICCGQRSFGKRRILREAVGADVVVDPRVESPRQGRRTPRLRHQGARHARPGLRRHAPFALPPGAAVEAGVPTPPNGSAPYRRARSFSNVSVPRA